MKACHPCRRNCCRGSVERTCRRWRRLALSPPFCVTATVTLRTQHTCSPWLDLQISTYRQVLVALQRRHVMDLCLEQSDSAAPAGQLKQRVLPIMAQLAAHHFPHLRR